MKAYGHLNPSYPTTYPGRQGNGRKKCLLIGVPLAVVLLIIIIVVSVVASQNHHHKEQQVPVGSKAIQSICSQSNYPDTCTSTLQRAPNETTANPKELAIYFIQVLMQQLNVSLSSVNETIGSGNYDANVTHALDVCFELLDTAWEQLDDAVTLLDNSLNSPSSYQDELSRLDSLLAAATTFHDTCLEELVLAVNGPTNYPPSWPAGLDPTKNPPLPVQTPTDPVTAQGDYIRQLYSIALSIAAYLESLGDKLFNLPSVPKVGRKLLSMPEWDDREVHLRRLLQAAASRAPNVTVDAGGSGTFTTIQEAVDDTPTGSDSLFIIKVAAGIYKEQVTISKKQINILLVGSGIDQTVITGDLSVMGTGSSTFRSCTLCVNGAGFLGTAFTVANTAGAANHQAVALRSSADKTAFFQVKMTGFQDTLYTHSFTQFYSQCTVVGTVDFIFGNAAAFFQNSKIIATVGLLGQQNTFTAQGRTDPNSKTGIVFQDCTFSPDATYNTPTNLANFKTYLGRPWKNYSRTILVSNYLDTIVDPAGWLPWNGDMFLTTLDYEEFGSKGPGGGISQRVKWKGVHQLTTTAQVQPYLLDKFIAGSSWLPATTFTFYNTLTQ